MLINTSKHKEYPIWRYAVLYSELEGRLKALAAKYPANFRFDKIGASNESRDIFLVILADDITDKGVQSYEVFRKRALWQPDEVIEEIKSGKEYKIPLYFNCNIHGPEISGTDGMLAFIEEILGTPKLSVLKDTVILINICANPDGRCRGLDILNARGFDLNRDFAAQTQPETKAIVHGIITRFYPAIMVDFHGFMSSANILIDACTPPHNPNTEYDLLEPHLLRNSQKMGEVIYERLRLKTDIPAQIWNDGWEDYGSVYTACFSHFFGCIAHTLETNFPTEEGAAVTHCAAIGSVEYAMEHKNELLINQCTYFLRGLRKESNNARIPEYFVVPYSREKQKDLEVVRDAMETLIHNGVKVYQNKTADRFVIPTAQPLRGLINNLLWKGEDITDIIENMYDVSFHSYPVMRGFETIEADSLADSEELIEVKRIEPPQGPDELQPERMERIKNQKILIVADSAGAHDALTDLGFDADFLPFSELNRGYQIKPESYDVFLFGGTKLGIWSDAYDETLGVGYGNTFALRERGREEVIEAARKFSNIILFGYAGVKLYNILNNVKAGDDQEDYADWHLNTANGSFRLILDESDPLCSGYGREQTAYVVGPIALEPAPDTVIPIRFAEDTFLNGWCKNREEFNGKPAALYKKSPQGTTVLLGFDPCFRKYMDATFRIMANAVFLTGYGL